MRACFYSKDITNGIHNIVHSVFVVSGFGDVFWRKHSLTTGARKGVCACVSWRCNRVGWKLLSFVLRSRTHTRFDLRKSRSDLLRWTYKNIVLPKILAIQSNVMWPWHWPLSTLLALEALDVINVVLHSHHHLETWNRLVTDDALPWVAVQPAPEERKAKVKLYGY